MAAKLILLPDEFLHWLEANHERGMSCATLCRMLIADWRSGQQIPGYGNCRAYWKQRAPKLKTLPMHSLPTPRGWSETNLRRLLIARRNLNTSRSHE